MRFSNYQSEVSLYGQPTTDFTMVGWASTKIGTGWSFSTFVICVVGFILLKWFISLSRGALRFSRSEHRHSFSPFPGSPIPPKDLINISQTRVLHLEAFVFAGDSFHQDWIGLDGWISFFPKHDSPLPTTSQTKKKTNRNIKSVLDDWTSPLPSISRSRAFTAVMRGVARGEVDTYFVKITSLKGRRGLGASCGVRSNSIDLRTNFNGRANIS